MLEDYLKAKKIGEKTLKQELSLGHDPYLSSLEEKTDIAEKKEKDLGLLEIPTEFIVGTFTSARKSAFAKDFMPIIEKDSEFAHKWSSLYDIQIEEGFRDPITVYEYHGDFYVEEGNKRVSVARYLEIPSLMAEVRRILPDGDSPEDELYREFLAFYEGAGIYSIRLHHKGSYQKFCAFYGKTLKEKWKKEEVNALLAGYYRFRSVYEKRTDPSFYAYAGDGYLIYLSVYGPESILDIPRQVLENRVERLLKEIVLSVKEDGNSLLETPKEEEKKNPLLRIVSSLAPKYTEDDPLKIAFLYRYSPEDSAWVKAHEEGRKYLETFYKGIVKTEKYENVADDEAVLKAIDNAALNGAKVIFATSSAHLEAVFRSSIHYPDIRFYNCSLDSSFSSIPTYYIRVYEAKFLLGALAASLNNGHDIAYISDYPVDGNIASVNAFAIGAAYADPSSRVRLFWPNNSVEERRRICDEEGISIVSGHDIVRPGWENELGLYRKNEDGSVSPVAKITFDFGKYYEIIVKDILDDITFVGKNAKAVSYWYGLSSGVIDIKLSENVSYYSKKLTELLKEALIRGSIHPFEGEIHSTEKEIQKEYSVRMKNEDIIAMNWLNDNIIGSIPDSEDTLKP